MGVDLLRVRSNSWLLLLVGSSLSVAVACGGSGKPPAYVPPETPSLPAHSNGQSSAPVARDAPAGPPPSLLDERPPPPVEVGPSCKRVPIGPTTERPHPLDYMPLYPVERSKNGRAAEGLEAQARKIVHCFFPGFTAVDIAMTRDEQHPEGSLAVAVVGVRGPGCETYEVELELQADWRRRGTRLDVRRSTVPRPSAPACQLDGGWKTHTGNLAPWGLSNGHEHGALGLAVLVYSAFHPGTARTATCVLSALSRHAQGHDPDRHADGRWQLAGLSILQQLLRVQPGEAELVELTRSAAAEHALGVPDNEIESVVVGAQCFGGHRAH